jgi:hypothetical protein
LGVKGEKEKNRELALVRDPGCPGFIPAAGLFRLFSFPLCRSSFKMGRNSQMLIS